MGALALSTSPWKETESTHEVGSSQASLSCTGRKLVGWACRETSLFSWKWISRTLAHWCWVCCHFEFFTGLFVQEPKRDSGIDIARFADKV